jgi:hypothetical protein
MTDPPVPPISWNRSVRSEPVGGGYEFQRRISRQTRIIFEIARIQFINNLLFPNIFLGIYKQMYSVVPKGHTEPYIPSHQVAIRPRNRRSFPRAGTCQIRTWNWCAAIEPRNLPDELTHLGLMNCSRASKAYMYTVSCDSAHVYISPELCAP